MSRTAAPKANPEALLREGAPVSRSMRGGVAGRGHPVVVALVFAEIISSFEASMIYAAMPTLMRPLFPVQRETSVLYTTCPNACCSSPFCMNTAFSNLTLAEQGIRSEIQQHHHAHKDERS